MRDWAPVALVALVFAVLCLAFNVSTPYRKPGFLRHQKADMIQDIGAPDERQHANYVARLMRGEGFPVLRPGDPDLYESYQAHQPPLYYVAAALWCRVAGQDPTEPANGLWLRLLSTVFGVATIFGLAAGAQWLTNDRRCGWAAATLGLVPMHVALSSAASNDPLLIALCTWTLALLALGSRRGWSVKTALLIGLLSGLAFLTKTTAVALMPCVAVGLGFAWKGLPGRDRWLATACALALPVLIAAPWWIRNQQLYGDPLAMKAFTAAFTGSPQASVFINGLGAAGYWTSMVAWWTFRSLIGVFGYMDIFLFEGPGMEASNRIYIALGLLLFVPIAWSVASLVAKDPESRPARKGIVVGALFAALVSLFFLRFNMQYFQGQGRYLYPALAPAAWAFGTGSVLMAKARASWAWVVPLSILVLLDVVSLVQLTTAFTTRVV